MTDGGGGGPGVPGGDGSLGGGPGPGGALSEQEVIRMVRADPAPWGFRLMGGRDYSLPLTVTRVLGCSLAEHAGLKVGDVVVSVNGVPVRGATHMEAQEAVRAAGDSLTLGVIRGSMDMPPPLDVNGVPLIQPPLAHEPAPVPEGDVAGAPGGGNQDQDGEDQQQQDGQDLGAEGDPAREGDNAAEDAADVDQAGGELEDGAQNGGEEEGGDEGAEEEDDEDEEEEDSDEEDEERRRERLDKLDGIKSPRSRLSRSPGPEDILRMQEKALARMEKARARKDRPPTVFLLPPDRPVIRQPRAPRPRPPDPPFKKLVHERIRRRKWAEEHPGEEYPFVDETGRTPTPDSELTTRATMTPTPTLSEGVDLDVTSELTDELGGGSHGGRSGRSSAASPLREDGAGTRTASQASRRTRTPDDDLEERDEEQEEVEQEEEQEEPEEVLTALSVEQTERRLEEVSAQLDALHNLPRSLRPSVQHIRAELQELVERLLEQVPTPTLSPHPQHNAAPAALARISLAELRRREEEEERLAEEARLAAAREAEAAERAERERREAEARAERERREAAERAEAEAKAAKAAKFKTDVPDFIHEMTEKLSLERPSFPLTPLPRPIVLPGGRKWRTVADAFNEDFIAETLTSQAEVLLGKALGNRRLSNTFPALIHERAEINESCYGCGRINFHKYSHKHDNLKNSAVYRMVHGLDDQPGLPVAERPAKMKAINDYYQAAARLSATPSPRSELERVTAEVKPDTVS
ncbi:PDZ and LIM domain protein 7 [Frankliniella fusca]|uniref:PDZ and LIM domain protein 7 n=1 Tax=Frankliniella fusca TaxID=407009 RepID=A0AAE1H405_9NEOP|nr:PDZ and LIM domain protein 7 [Frankliniella fusca]